MLDGQVRFLLENLAEILGAETEPFALPDRIVAPQVGVWEFLRTCKWESGFRAGATM